MALMMYTVNHRQHSIPLGKAAFYGCTRRSFIIISALLLLVLVTPLAFGQSAGEADLLTRSALTGDWGGARSWLADNGVSLDLRYTSFYQGLASGTGDKDFEYGGKIDAFINLNSNKMGLWEGGGFRSHLEYSHGDAPANLGGAIFAVNTALYWPTDTPEELVATSLYFTQKVGDRSSIALGKFNPVDLLAADPFYGGWGIDRFMNLILAAPPSGLIPVVFMGAVANIRTKPVIWTVMAFDPNDRTNDYFPGDLFSDGVNISVSGAHNTTLAGRKTTYAATVLYSTAEGTDYSSLGGLNGTSTKSGSYNISFEFKHNLQESTKEPNATWGFYLKAAIADGNPNYVQRSLVVGIGGKALFFGRPQDSFGVGAYLYNLSDTLQDSLNPSYTNFQDEGAIEAFYSWAMTPWLQIGADIQYINPARGDYKNALVPSLRTQIRF
jgi:porin